MTEFVRLPGCTELFIAKSLKRLYEFLNLTFLNLITLP